MGRGAESIDSERCTCTSQRSSEFKRLQINSGPSDWRRVITHQTQALNEALNRLNRADHMIVEYAAEVALPKIVRRATSQDVSQSTPAPELANPKNSLRIIYVNLMLRW
jgi:hypothetical protein